MIAISLAICCAVVDELSLKLPQSAIQRKNNDVSPVKFD